jgi:HAD superfamily hydrolase (TIGR01509 family)
MTHRALLIDFGGTLFLPLETKQWLAAAARTAGIALDDGEHSRLASLFDIELRASRRPGSDLSPAAHRQGLLPVFESLGVGNALATALYDVQMADEFWRLRNGASELLRRASEQGIRVIIVSNIPWDLRPLFASTGLSDHIHEYVLSYELGVEKPDKPIFEHALTVAGCAPAEALFVGDDSVNDSGALQIGIPVVLIPDAPDDTDRALFIIADWLTSAIAWDVSAET